ncbi:toll/interleukin-1 receptor domain-containing protein [Claveliimonas bilis]|uniref:SEFIR domain-containing protein n=1 Tax=Claveliimonas bilis TaxID=3028070 RepID=A0ABM8I324_9FIRM|nr:toll/interleukin-1 receptor domain-containing protein [Claveliimonas bilis]BDZ76436.1 hypothetical protein Lac1_06190 [Claveliimonas bilis]
MIFVSYSWINEKPDKKVLQLVAKMRENGYEAECDVMKIQEHASINFVEMMTRNLQEAEKVIVVLSESYKKKADSFVGGVGAEYRYIISHISEETQKYILVSFDRNLAKVQPNFLSQRQVIFLDNDSGFEQLLYKLNDIGEYSFPKVNPNKTVPPIQQISSKEYKNKESNLFTGNRYNLFVSADKNAWEGDSYLLERERCLTSYTPQEIKELYDGFGEKQIEEIESYPCIFAYEDQIKKDAYIGYIKDIIVRSRAIKFYFQKQGVLTFDDLHKYAFEFDIELSGGITELMHTHWTIKNVNLGEEIRKRDILVIPYNVSDSHKEIVPSNSIELLKILLLEDNPVDYMGKLFKIADDKMDSRLRAMLRDLREKGYLTSYWADNVPYKITFNESAYLLQSK